MIAENTARVARLERLLGTIQRNAVLPRAAKAASVAPRMSSRAPSVEVSAYEEDIEDFPEVELVEIEVDVELDDRLTVPGDVQDYADFGSAASGHELEALPEGITPLDDGAGAFEAGAASVGIANESMFGEEIAIPLQSKRESEQPPAWRPDMDQPTVEQLGATIGLEAGAAGPALELDMQSVPPDDSSDFEVSLPARGFAGGYDANLESPPNAQEDLASLYRSDATLAGSGAMQAALEPAQGLAPHVVERSVLSPASPVAEVLDNRKAAGGSAFMALLDDAMSLTGR